MFATNTKSNHAGAKSLYRFGVESISGKSSVEFLQKNFAENFTTVSVHATNWLNAKSVDERKKATKRLRAAIRNFVSACASDVLNGGTFSKENAEKFLAFAQNTYVGVTSLQTLTGRNISDAGEESVKERETLCAHIRLVLGAKVQTLETANAKK